MKRRLPMLGALTCALLLVLAPLGMCLWSLSVLRAEERHKTRVTWGQPRLLLPFKNFIGPKSCVWMPSYVHINGSVVHADRLASALPWLPGTVRAIRITIHEDADAIKVFNAATQLHQLETLNFIGAPLDAESVEGLRRLPRLKHLQLQWAPEDLSRFPRLLQLESVRLSTTVVKPDSLARLYACPNLKRLQVLGKSMSLAEMKAFDWRHSRLEVLLLGQIEASDAELNELMAQIKTQAPTLKTLYINNGLRKK